MLQSLSDTVYSIVDAIPGIVDLETSLGQPRPEYRSSPCSLPSPARGWSRRTRRTISRQVTCSALRRRVNATKGTSATSASETHRCSASSQTAWGYLIGVQASSPMPAMAALAWGFIRTVTENQAPWRRAVATKAWP